MPNGESKKPWGLGVDLAPIRRISVSDFIEEVFGYLPRSDQRRWARTYLRGLLNVPGKKSLQHMARAAATGLNASHGLQQFINSSPWDWTPAREALGRSISEAMPVIAWAAGILSIPKRGEHSVGVHRRFVPHAGRTLNCQVAVGMFLSSEEQAVPVDWHLFLDPAWSGDEQRRRRARIPGHVSALPLCMHVLELADQMRARRPGPTPPLVADLRVGMDISRLADELSARGMDFVIEVRAAHPVLAAAGSLRAAGRATVVRPTTVSEVWRQDPPQAAESPRGPAIAARAVRLPGAPQTYRLLTQWWRGDHRTRRYWITSILDQTAEAVLALDRHAARAEAVMKDLEKDFGVLDFAGRSFPGWHHHMTMVSAAYAYRTLLSGDDGALGRAHDERGHTALLTM
ncbi:hypothetical protein C1I98_29780 [Spongiactinospora gelatinilytica]|uniref:Transposase IS701-like DDE domain-containing protein n=1 Tax=Spongiactinospora gelatinilytica TaxID=2666298 RepID=A0A2W2F7H7_9ACTN|nr:transposase [Spongiactinospora gelatinilytica]PZG31812.1 hypothetical protein C1I98_29780 [Spongiactinospora gelatinilytica]